MTSDPTTAAAPSTDRQLRTSILAFVDHAGIRAHGSSPVSSNGLRDGLELADLAEELGYDAFYVHVRHLQDTLASPLTFLAAASQRTSRIELGTAVIPLRFENAGRLAEDIATVDLLSGGRLRVGMGSGYNARSDSMNMRAFGSTVPDVRLHTDRVLNDLVAFLDGEQVAVADAHVESLDAGSPLRIEPRSPGLRERLAYGAATERSAALAGVLGLGLQLGTMQPADGSGRSFEQMQADLITVYREAREDAGFSGRGHVSVARLALPVESDEDLEMYDGIITKSNWRQRAHRDGTVVHEIGGNEAIYGAVHADAPAAVAAALTEDVAVQAADELMLSLPMDRPADFTRRISTTFAQKVVPLLR